MSDKDYEIEFSNINERSQNQYLMDYVPDQMIKVYPYRASKANKNKPFIQTLTASIIRLTQNVEDYSNLQTDDKGNKFVEMFAAWDEQTKVTVTSGAETFQQDIRKLRTYTALFNNFFTMDDDKPDFFTIGEPFDNAKYKAGTQRMYYGSNFQPSAQELIVDLIDQGYNVNEETRLAEITMQDVATLEEQYNKSVLLFTTDSHLFVNPQITYKSRLENKVVTKPGIRLRTNSYSLINGVKSKGQLDIDGYKQSPTDIDYYTENALVSIKMSPDKVTDKVVMYSDWFDYNNTMPYFVADYFNNPDGAMLKDLIMYGDANESYRYNINNAIGPDLNHIIFSGNGQKISVTETIKESESLWELKDIETTSSFIRWTGSGAPETLRPTSTPIQVNKFTKTNKSIFEYEYTYNEDITFTSQNQKTITIGDLKFSFNKNILTTTFTIKNSSGIPNGDQLDYVFLSYFKVTPYSELLQKEDIALIEDMIVISAGFKDNWNRAPRDANSPDKIDPGFRIGNQGLLISSISGKKPADVIDGLIMQHEDLYPSFRTNEQRYKAFKFIVNALSKYIASNTYTTNTGFNELVAITQPWFLLLAPKDDNIIDYWTNKSYVLVRDMAENPAGQNPPNTQAKDTKLRRSYVLKGTSHNANGDLENLSSVRFKLYTSYFKKQFSQLNDYIYAPGINIPDKMNLSSLKVIESDRKVILPELRETVAENNKINIPGQNTGTEDYLSNYFLLPVKDISDIERVYLNGKKSSNNFKPGESITINLPRGNDGEYWDTEKVKKEIYKIYGRENIQDISDNDIVINIVESFEEQIYGSYVNNPDNPNDGRWTSRNREFWWGDLNSLPRTGESGSFLPGDYTKQRVIENFKYDERMFTWRDYDYSYVNWESGRGLQGHRRYLYTRGSLTMTVKHAEFLPITITFTNNVSKRVANVQLEKRQTYFDKTEWMKFINTFLMPVGQMIDLYLVSEGDTTIDYLDEFSLMSIWTDEIRLSCDGMSEELVFKVPSSTDETIAIQRIVVI